MGQRIALIIPGGIGVGHHNEGVPVLEALFTRLGRKAEVIIFPLGKVNPGYEPPGFAVAAIPLDYDAPLRRRIWRTVRHIRRAHRQRPFDCLHGFWAIPAGFLAVTMGKLLGVRSVVSVQGGDLMRIEDIGYGARSGRLLEKLIFWTLRKADVVTVETRFQQDLLPAALRGKAKIIPYGVDTEQFVYRPRPLREPVQLIHVASLNPVKDQATLLRCFQLLTRDFGCRLTIIGPDYLDGRLRRLARELGVEDKVTFTGYVRHRELPEYLARAHLMLHTSRHEGMPVVAVEAMAAGVAVCGTAVGVLADLAPDCCLAVPVGDHEALARKVKALLADDERLERLRQEAYRWSRAHTINWTAERFGEIYRGAPDWSDD